MKIINYEIFGDVETLDVTEFNLSYYLRVNLHFNWMSKQGFFFSKREEENKEVSKRKRIIKGTK